MSTKLFLKEYQIAFEENVIMINMLYHQDMQKSQSIFTKSENSKLLNLMIHLFLYI